jgi:site-specific DNA-cytosine methylase
MGFTDDFKTEDEKDGWKLSKAQSYKQSGNSIVVDVFIAILRNLLPHINY